MPNVTRLSHLAPLTALLLAALACNFPQPAAPRPAPSPLIEAFPAAKNRPVAAAPEEPGPLPIEHLPRLSPTEEMEIEIGPPGTSPQDSDRPTLSGPAQTLDTEHFRIHYTLSGGDAVPRQDNNGNQQPDYVEHVARALEYVWYAEIEVFGWPAPPADGSLGGDGRVDVYLQNIMTDEDTAGYVTTSQRGATVGDNPNTEIRETNSQHSYMVLDNDYREIASPRSQTNLDYMRVVVAHEFMHVIQYGIDGSEPAEWLWEATATWIEDEVYDHINDGLTVLTAPFKAPDSCQMAYGGEERVEDLDNWYGQWLFLRFISERYGHATVRAIWEQAVTHDGYGAVGRALAAVGTSLPEVFREYSLALLTRDFEEGDTYPLLRLEGVAVVDEPFTPVDGVAQMGADYIEIEASAPVTIRLEGSLPGWVVGVRGEEVHLYTLEDGPAGVDAAAFERLYLIVMNPEAALRERHCAFTDYSVQVLSGGAPQTADEIRGRAYFHPPRVEGLHDPESYWGINHP